MAELTYRDAVAAAIAQEMRRDPNVVFLGEDIAAAGGVFKATQGLLDEFGPDFVDYKKCYDAIAKWSDNLDTSESHY